MVKIEIIPILASSFAILARGQDLISATKTYPLETITWHLATEYISGVISAHTQLATIDAVTFLETLVGNTATFSDERYTILRTVEARTFTRQIPRSTIAASLKLTSISRTLLPSIYTGTDPFEITVEIETSGIPGNLYTLTGPISNGVALGTVIQRLDERSVIKTIPGPTITHDIGIGEEMVETVNGLAETRYGLTSSFTETFSSTLVTRRIASSSLAREVTITVSSSPSPSGSVSGIQSARSFSTAPTVTVTEDVTASITMESTTAYTSVGYSTLGVPQATFGLSQPGNEIPRSSVNSASPAIASNPAGNIGKCVPITKSSKCHVKSKPTKCLRSWNCRH